LFKSSGNPKWGQGISSRIGELMTGRGEGRKRRESEVFVKERLLKKRTFLFRTLTEMGGKGGWGARMRGGGEKRK